MRTTVSGMRNGRPVITFTANWFISTDIDADWKLRGHGWQVQVEGDGPLHMHLHFTVPEALKAETTPGDHATRTVTTVQHVSRADPGTRPAEGIALLPQRTT